jgi:WD40 repeat protein
MNTFVGNTNSQVFCARFNNDDKMIVTGTVDGDIKVYDVY